MNRNAVILKARAFVGGGSAAEGTQLLERQVQIRGSDKAVLKALLNLYKYTEDRQGIARTAERLLVQEPDDADLQMMLIRELYALGQHERARLVAVALARSSPNGNALADILSLWLTYEKRSQSLADVRSLAANSRTSARILYAQFMLQAGAAREAAALLQETADLPVTSSNADALAVLGRALHASSASKRGLEVLNAVLAFDPTNILALRARADIALSSQNYRQALADASRAVAEAPRSAQDRLRLARYYLQTGDLLMAEKVYWDAFRDIPATPSLYNALRTFLVSAGRHDSLAALQGQYNVQRDLAKARTLFV
jgi:tetratricopeptide (TPR) repeat protein